MNINKTILLDKIKGQSVDSANLKVLYDWEFPESTNDFVLGDLGNISDDNKLIFNSVHGIDAHLIDKDINKLASGSMLGLSVGLQHNAITKTAATYGNASFQGDDIIHIVNSPLISTWTVLIDLEEIECSTTKNKSIILFTNRNEISDTKSFVVGINGANCLFYEGCNADGDKIIKTLIKPVGEKSLIAVSRSNITNSVSIYVYDPILETITGKSFFVNEHWSAGNWCLGGTFKNFVSDSHYEKFNGKMNSFLLFDVELSNTNILTLFEAFSLTSFTAKHYEKVSTQVPRQGQSVSVDIEDGFQVTGYDEMQSQVITNTGQNVVLYNSVPRIEKKYKTVNQYIASTETVTKMIRTLVPESKTKDVASAQKYVEKCILLNKDADKAQRIEFYSRDDYVGDCGKKALFAPSDSTFYVDKSYSDPTNITIYLNGLLKEPDVDYQIVDGRTIKLLNGVFAEIDEVVYDTHSNEKYFADFFGYNGDIYLYSHKGKDVYLDGKKLIFEVDYEDDPNNDFLIIHAAGLLAGKIGLVTRPSEVTHNENFYNKYYHCNTYNVIDEQIWADGKRVYKNSGYSLTCPCNLNNSDDKAEQKTTIIYNNDGGFFNI
jgi:hypothetical protein